MSELWLVFQYANGTLLPGKGTYSSRHTQACARAYSSEGQAKSRWNALIKQGYQAKAAKVTLSQLAESFGAEPTICWVHEGWTAKVDLCDHTQRVAGEYLKCYRRKGHKGIHWAGREAKKDPDYDPETALKETVDV